MRLSDIVEDRNPNIEYTEKKKKGEIDRIVAELKGDESGVWTRIGNRYERMFRIMKLLEREKKDLNTRIKENFDAVFDAEDEVYTRVLETLQLVMTLAKPTEKTTERFDVGGFLDELKKLLPDLTGRIEELVEIYTETETKTISPALRVKAKPKDSVKIESQLSEGVGDRLRKFAQSVYRSIMSKLKRFDSKFSDLKARVESELV